MTRKYLHGLSYALIAVISLTFAACGGSSSSSTPSTGTISGTVSVTKIAAFAPIRAAASLAVAGGTVYVYNSSGTLLNPPGTTFTGNTYSVPGIPNGVNYFVRVVTGNGTLTSYIPSLSGDNNSVDVNPYTTALVKVLGAKLGHPELGTIGVDVSSVISTVITPAYFSLVTTSTGVSTIAGTIAGTFSASFTSTATGTSVLGGTDTSINGTASSVASSVGTSSTTSSTTTSSSATATVTHTSVETLSTTSTKTSTSTGSTAGTSTSMSTSIATDTKTTTSTGTATDTVTVTIASTVTIGVTDSITITSTGTSSTTGGTGTSIKVSCDLGATSGCFLINFNYSGSISNASVTGTMDFYYPDASATYLAPYCTGTKVSTGTVSSTSTSTTVNSSTFCTGTVVTACSTAYTHYCAMDVTDTGSFAPGGTYTSTIISTWH